MYVWFWTDSIGMIVVFTGAHSSCVRYWNFIAEKRVSHYCLKMLIWYQTLVRISTWLYTTVLREGGLCRQTRSFFCHARERRKFRNQAVEPRILHRCDDRCIAFWRNVVTHKQQNRKINKTECRWGSRTYPIFKMRNNFNFVDPHGFLVLALRGPLKSTWYFVNFSSCLVWYSIHT